jgi:hypothetical protein
MTFKKGDRVRPIGLISKEFGTGKVTSIKLNVATVLFSCGTIQSYSFEQIAKGD